MSEFPPRLRPTAEERERIARANKEADPTTFSAIAPEELQPAGEVKYVSNQETRTVGISEDTDGRWYKVAEDRAPVRQQLAARLLKGVVNVADVVDKEGTFYSKEMPHDRIQNEASDDEVHADLALLTIMLGDHDRKMADEEFPEGHNIRREGDGKASYFDFGGLYLGTIMKEPQGELTTPALHILSKKLHQLKAQYEGPDGREFAWSLYDSYAAKEDKHRLMAQFGTFYDGLLRRLDEGLEFTAAKLQEREPKKKGWFRR